jgi:hypothetical protein
MSPSKLIRKIAIGIILVGASSLVWPQNEIVSWDFPDLTATEVIQMALFDRPMKIYRFGSSTRVERTAAWSTLYVPSTSKTYNLTTYPDGSRQCVSMKPEQAKMMPSPLELLNGTKISRTPAGTEVIEGHSCKVENVVVIRNDGKTVESKVWEADDLQGVPVKIESHVGEHKITAVYRDIVLGAPDKTLFIPPDRCTPFEKMGQVAERVEVK